MREDRGRLVRNLGIILDRIEVELNGLALHPTRDDMGGNSVIELHAKGFLGGGRSTLLQRHKARLTKLLVHVKNIMME